MELELDAQIIKIDAKNIRPLRHSELRKGKDYSTTSYLKDNEKETFHLACLLDDRIVTCATFYPQKTGKIRTENSFRLRGMATDSGFKRQGFGAKLMKESFILLKVSTSSLILCPSTGPKYLKPKSSNMVVGKKKFFALDSAFLSKD